MFVWLSLCTFSCIFLLQEIAIFVFGFVKKTTKNTIVAIIFRIIRFVFHISKQLLPQNIKYILIYAIWVIFDEYASLLIAI